jgi:hypothetical protein
MRVFCFGRFPVRPLPHARDTPERLDYERMTRVVAGLEQVLIELAGGSRR